MATNVAHVTLHNGVEMPMLGFGVYQIPPDDTERAVADQMARIAALDTGASVFFDHRDPDIAGQFNGMRQA